MTGCVAGKKAFRRNLPDRLEEGDEEGDIIHLPSGKKIPPKVFDRFLTIPDVLYVGEAHENLEAHRVQLEALKTFHAKFGSDIVIGMEMFKRPYQSVLDDWAAGRLNEKNLLKKTEWDGEWGFDFQLYRDLLNYAKDNKIPIIALNATRELKNKIKSKGISGLSPEEKKELPEIDLSDLYHRLYLQKIFTLHRHDKDQFEKFYDVQCFWEDYMAESISRYLTSPAGRGKKMIVFVGNGHLVYDFGIPKRVFGRTHLPYLTVYPYERRKDPEDFDPIMLADIPLEPADFLVVVPFKHLEVKHAVLGVVIDATSTNKVIIRNVHQNSPAEKAELKVNDLIIAIDGETVTELFDITYALKQKNPKDSCRLSILREGKPLDITVELFPWKYH